MTEREALKLALEALEEAKLHIWLGDKKGVAANIKCHQTITAIEEALSSEATEMSGTDGAQPEQLMSDQINYGMSVTQGGKRIDPMSIYKEPEQETTDSEMFKIRSAYQKGFEHGMEQSPQRKDSSADALIRQYVNALVANKPDEAANATKQMVDYVYTTPPPVAEPHKRKPLTAMEVYDVVHDADLDWHTGFALGEDENRFVVFARAIEAAHGIKELKEYKK